jgi:hypothetical protein
VGGDPARHPQVPAQWWCWAPVPPGWTGAGILRADALAQTATDAGSGDAAGDGRARCVCRRSSSVGKGLARGPAEVLGTLLQEAAHAPAHVRAVKETSRQGRW